jgi:hypothetical protein
MMEAVRQRDAARGSSSLCARCRARRTWWCVTRSEAVGLGPEPDHLGTELEQQVAREMVGGAVGAVDHDLEAVQGQDLGEAALQVLDVAAAGVVDPPGTAERRRRACSRPDRTA